MNTPISSNKNNKKTTIIIATVALVILVGGYFTAGALTKSLWPFSTPSDAANTTQSDNDKTANPPGTADDSINAKENAESNNSTNSTSSPENSNSESSTGTSSRSTVEIGVTYADVYNGSVEIRAFSPSVIEGNGTCTATLTQNSQQVASASKAFIDSTTTQCEPIYIPVSQFPSKGTWKLTLTYTSPTSTGSSEVIEVKL